MVGNAMIAPGRRRLKSALSEQGVINVHLREHIAPERRRVMVAEAAYFFAERRGFEPGYELDDWLAAEGQIDAALRVSEIEAAALLRQQKRSKSARA